MLERRLELRTKKALRERGRKEGREDRKEVR